MYLHPYANTFDSILHRDFLSQDVIMSKSVIVCFINHNINFRVFIIINSDSFITYLTIIFP